MSHIIFETERLIIKTTSLNEFNLISKLEKDAEVMKFIDNSTRTDEEIKRSIMLSIEHYQQYKYSSGSIYEKHTGNFVGRGGLYHYFWENKNEEIELGYRLLKQYWGLGYATELARAWVNYGFQSFSFPYIVAVVSPNNTASANVLKKLEFNSIGFHLYGNILEEKYICQNKYFKNEK